MKWQPNKKLGYMEPAGRFWLLRQAYGLLADPSARSVYDAAVVRVGLRGRGAAGGDHDGDEPTCPDGHSGSTKHLSNDWSTRRRSQNPSSVAKDRPTTSSDEAAICCSIDALSESLMSDSRGGIPDEDSCQSTHSDSRGHDGIALNAAKKRRTDGVYCGSDYCASGDIVHEVPVSLEELYTGCRKRFKISKAGSESDASLEEKVLCIDVQPGWPDGTQLRFPGAATPSTTTSSSSSASSSTRTSSAMRDVVIVLREAKHPVFTRRGADIFARVRVPLLQALSSRYITFRPLCGSGPIRVDLPKKLEMDDFVVFPGAGMPDRTGRGHGDLHLHIHIDLPANISPGYMPEVRRLLADAAARAPPAWAPTVGVASRISTSGPALHRSNKYSDAYALAS